MLYYFDSPATTWEETFPLGNGRVGLMPDGGIDVENYVLNEISMWSGCEHDTDNPDACLSLPKIRELLFSGRADEAQDLMYKSFVCGGKGSGHGAGANVPYGSYQLLGNLKIMYHYGALSRQPVSGYRRELNLNTAVATTTFQKSGHTYTREAFTSFAHDIAVIKLNSGNEKVLDFTLQLQRPERYKVSAYKEGLFMQGQLNSGDSSKEGLHYAAKIKVLFPEGGNTQIVNDTLLQIKDCAEAWILIASATDYFHKNAIEPDLDSLLSYAATKSYEQLKSAHTTAYREKFERVHVDFGHDSLRESLPINERLRLFQQDHADPSLAALYFQFGRYLLISSARPGLLPPNLQGLWSNTVQTPWNGDYHANINVQMNHWISEVGNLPELHEPLLNWIQRQVPSGQHTAKVFYNARGWVMHILGNPWQFTAPGEHPSWGATNTSAAWLCSHLYYHYLYHPDTAYLARVYPVMKEAALFFVDMLVEDPRNHYLVTAPTTSPENGYRLPNGKTAAVCAGSTMDNQILRELFNHTIEAARILNKDKDFSVLLAQKRDSLKPTTIGTDGRIMEWLEPYEETEIHHRHVSHLYGLHPSHEISVHHSPALANAARQSLEIRGDASTGWSMAWKINFWARLHDGERAFKLLGDLLTPTLKTQTGYWEGGGTYPNLFCSHPPFQIDGNFGGSAGIAEMLLQSQNGFIEILPAIPTAWVNGSYSGLRVEGGGEVSVTWQNGNAKTFTLKALCPNTFKLKLPETATTFHITLNGKTISCTPRDGLCEINLKTNDLWQITW
jgi:alpha-L-fucosidase 2